ncbi:MAG: DUF6452 family protein [Bacteroidota bacterium]
MKSGILFLIVILCVVMACQDEADCISSTTDFVNLRFYKVEDNETATIEFFSLKPLASDSTLLSDTTINSVIRLPLDLNATSTSFVFDTEFGRDTLILGYETSTRLISEECGIELLVFGLQSLRNDFDSIQVVNDILVEEINEDIRIYN